MKAKQTVLRESLCGRVSGGKLDFPRHASFAAIKIVKWWEAEFLIAFRHPSGLCISTEPISTSIEGEEVIKKTPPSEFIMLVVDTSQLFIEHLHALIQESLDHADLAVLTATLGAAALVRNCLWCYNQQSKDKIPKQSSEKLYEFYKSYQEMAEAVAERLLDLHCRLISLYILNEADSLSWQSDKYFFEKERSSFIIQMWWLYMQGTKADLWDTVSPKMAQRIFAGMLNESLTIIVARFIHGRPSLQRSEQFWADAFNVLSCTSYLALSACDDGDELIAIRTNKLSIVMRDIHAKCGELLVCLLLRGTPLKLLYQICRNGLENMAMLDKRCGPSPWLLIAAPKLFGNSTFKDGITQLSEDQLLILQVHVLRSQPQPNWTQLLKVLSMRNCTVARMLLITLIRQCSDTREKDKIFHEKKSLKGSSECEGFLCAGDHKNISNFPPPMCLYSLMYVSVNTPMNPMDVIIPGLKQDVNWSNYLDRQQVWNQSRPPWLNALLQPLRQIMDPVVEILLEAVKTGASIYQAMSLALACITELFVCAPMGILRAANMMNQSIPAHCHPMGLRNKTRVLD
uniref:KIAA0825_1 protein n=1 Tax=Fopius arisanus TaxID=64838 RepID=A0A0C9RUR4_9HYME